MNEKELLDNIIPFHKRDMCGGDGMFPQLRKLGEALTRNYPNNDCAVFLSIYDAYNNIAKDYDRVLELIPDLDHSTKIALNRQLSEYHHELYMMYKNNYAVGKYRKEHNL